MNTTPYYTIEEATKLLGLSNSRVRQLIRDEKLNLVPITGVMLLFKEEVENFKNLRKVGKPSENFHKHKVCKCEECLNTIKLCEICKLPSFFFDIKDENKYYCANHMYLHKVCFLINEKYHIIYNCCGKLEIVEILEESEGCKCKFEIKTSDSFVRSRENTIKTTNRRQYYKDKKENSNYFLSKPVHLMVRSEIELSSNRINRNVKDDLDSKIEYRINEIKLRSEKRKELENEKYKPAFPNDDF